MRGAARRLPAVSRERHTPLRGRWADAAAPLGSSMLGQAMVHGSNFMSLLSIRR